MEIALICQTVSHPHRILDPMRNWPSITVFLPPL